MPFTNVRSICVSLPIRNKNRPSQTAANASVHGPFLMGPKSLTQNPFEYFAGATLRQLGVQELNPAWNLVIGERAAAVSHQVFRAEDLSRLQHDTGHHQFAPLRVRYSEDRGLPNHRMVVKTCLDLAGIDILAARDNHVLQAVQDVKKTVRILTADVSRAKEAVPEGKSGFLRVLPIATHDIRASSHQFARLTGRNFCS